MKEGAATPTPATDEAARPRRAATDRIKFFVLAGFAVALACTPVAQAADAGRTLRVQMLGDVETLDPARAPDTGTAYSLAPLFHQLLTYAYGSRQVEKCRRRAVTTVSRCEETHSALPGELAVVLSHPRELDAFVLIGSARDGSELRSDEVAALRAALQSVGVEWQACAGTRCSVSSPAQSILR